MTKFIRMVVLATLVMWFIPNKISAQTPEIGFDKVAQLTQEFTKKYTNGLHNPDGYMIKFSKQELQDLIDSEPEADSINLVLGRFLKDAVDSLREKPTVIFQFYIPSKNGVGASYVYKVAKRLCPPPRSGCKVRPAPGQ